MKDLITKFCVGLWDDYGKITGYAVLIAVCAGVLISFWPGRMESDYPPSTDYEIREADDNALTIDLDARIKSGKDSSYRSKVSWTPIKSLKRLGTDVNEDVPLIEFDTWLSDFEIALIQNDRLQSVVNYQKQDLEADKSYTDLLIQKGDLERERKLVELRIEATREKDEKERQLYELDVERVEAEIKRRLDYLNRIRALAKTGSVPDIKLKEAEEAWRKAVEDSRVPKLVLETFLESTGSTDRALLSFDRQMLEAELSGGTGRSGVEARLQNILDRRVLRDRARKRKMKRFERRQERWDETVENSVIMSGEAGTFVENPRNWTRLEVGSKYPRSTLAFVQHQNRMRAELFLPESLRPVMFYLEQETGGRIELTLHLPSLPGEVFKGHISKVNNLPIASEDGRARGFICNVELERSGQSILVESTSAVRLTFDMPESFIKIPIWYVTSAEDQRVQFRNGTFREVEGFAAGNSFYVSSGLETGDVIKIPEGMEESEFRRIRSELQPRETDILRYDLPWRRRHKDGWYFDWVMEDGSTVKKGDELVRVSTQDENIEEKRDSLEESMLDAEASLEQKIANADLALKQKEVDWKKQKYSARKSRLDYLLTRYGSYEITQTRSNVALQKAMLDVEKARRDVKTKRADTSGFYSQNQVYNAELALKRAEANVNKQKLSMVNALRIRNWVKVADDMRAMEDELFQASMNRIEYSIGRAKYFSDIRQFQNDYRARMKRMEDRRRRIFNTSIYAPRDGRAFFIRHGNDIPAVGKELLNYDVIAMPRGNEWEAEFEIPARYYSDYEEGDMIPILIPVLSFKKMDGELVMKSPNLKEPTRIADDDSQIQSNNERVFMIRVRVALTSDQLQRVSAGVTTYMDVKR